MLAMPTILAGIPSITPLLGVTGLVTGGDCLAGLRSSSYRFLANNCVS